MKYPSYRVTLLIWLCFLSQVLLTIEAAQGDGQSYRKAGGSNAKRAGSTKPKPKPNRKGGRGRGGPNDKYGGDSTKGIWWVTTIFLLCLVPPFFIFIGNIWNDPMTPTLMRNAFDMAKDRTMAFLGKSKKDKEKAEARKLN